jgi:hypothetical protein
MMPDSEAEHTIRALRAELGDIRAAFNAVAESREAQAVADADGSLDKAAAIAQELAHSAFWFRAFHEKARQCRVLREEIARLKGATRG